MTYGEDLEFEVLGEHWHNMLKGAVESIRSNDELRVYWGSIGGSYIAFPLIYNYRHVMELYLKGMLVAGEGALLLAGQEGIDEEIFKSHAFQILRPEIERVFDVLGVQYDLEIKSLRTKKDFRRLLVDMDAMEVRYPIDTKRKPTMGNRFMCFNLFEFAATMDAILTALQHILSWLPDEVDERCRAAYENY